LSSTSGINYVNLDMNMAGGDLLMLGITTILYIVLLYLYETF